MNMPRKPAPSAREVGWLLREKHRGALTAAAKQDMVRLESGEHLDYVIGFANFLGLKVDLSERPLIPRPETEYWTEKAIQEMKSTLKHANSRIKALDVFCGSGCIGLAVLKFIPDATVDFADIEPRYFKGIKKSARLNKIPASRFRTTHSNVLRSVGMKKYDYILANPPYIPLSGRAVQRSVLEQEPRNALFAGRDGLRFIRMLLRDASGKMAPDGRLFFEFDPPQKREIGALGRRLRFDIRFFRDQYGRYRWAIAKRAA